MIRDIASEVATKSGIKLDHSAVIELEARVGHCLQCFVKIRDMWLYTH